MSMEDLRIRLNLLLLEKNITKRDVVRQTGGVYSYIADILNARRRPSKNYAKKIASVLEEDASELFREWEPGLFVPVQKKKK